MREREKEKMMFYVCWWREREEKGRKKRERNIKNLSFLKI